MKLVEVIWRDASTDLGSFAPNDPFEVAKVSTLGYLVDENSDRVVVTKDFIEFGDGEKQIRTVSVIPWENVITIKELRRK